MVEKSTLGALQLILRFKEVSSECQNIKKLIAWT
jgi:hypothetical protein